MKAILKTSGSIAGLLLAFACAPGSPPVSSSGPARADPLPLPTGRSIGSPEEMGPSIGVGNMPLAMAASPDRGRLAILLSGYREQGLQVVDVESRKVVQTLSQGGAFLGLAFSPDGTMLYASGGNEDAVFRYSWKDGQASLLGRIALVEGSSEKSSGSRSPRYTAARGFFPGGI